MIYISEEALLEIRMHYSLNCSYYKGQDRRNCTHIYSKFIEELTKDDKYDDVEIWEA